MVSAVVSRLAPRLSVALSGLTTMTASAGPGAALAALVSVALPPILRALGSWWQPASTSGLLAARPRARARIHLSLLGMLLVLATAACAGMGPAGSATGAAALLPPGAIVLQVGASSRSGFDTSALLAPADRPFGIAFDNSDTGVPHDVAIRDASGRVRFQGQIVTGPARITYAVAPLPAGTYTFYCAVHPDMQGTLTVR